MKEGFIKIRPTRDGRLASTWMGYTVDLVEGEDIEVPAAVEADAVKAGAVPIRPKDKAQKEEAPKGKAQKGKAGA